MLQWETSTSRSCRTTVFPRQARRLLPDISSPTTGSWRSRVSSNAQLELSLDELQARRRRSVEFTLERSGTTGSSVRDRAVGNARRAGASRAEVLRVPRPRDQAMEVVFLGDSMRARSMIRDDSGITGAGMTCSVAPDGSGGLDLLITEQFARRCPDEAMRAASCSVRDERRSLAAGSTGPVPAVAPGWYGVANVKWLSRIELQAGGTPGGSWHATTSPSARRRSRQDHRTFNTGRRARLKSAPAKVARLDDGYKIIGAAWGAPARKVQAARRGPWHGDEDRQHFGRTLDCLESGHTLAHPPSGPHTVTARAIGRTKTSSRPRTIR